MIRAIVTDIEGTTSSLAFVKDVLFPYAREHLGNYIRDHRDDPVVIEQLEAVRTEAGHALDVDAGLDDVISLLNQWIDQDRKLTPLKTLQGLVWEQGYDHGDFFGHIYADAVQVLQGWHEQGLSLYIYSSGSVHAQKLLFSHTEFGDLTPLFSGYFDTRIGAKGDVHSYQQIAGTLGMEADTILFLSDIEAELDAAKGAGMQTWMLVRNPELAGAGIDLHSRHRQAHSFAEIEW
jgi:enolase-phosphatase E1